MAAINFPTNPTRLNYAVNPWVDPYGSPWIWNQAKLRWRADVAPITLRRSAVPVNGATAGILGQTCIVTHTDGSITEWGCVGDTPVKWLPRGAVFLNTDTGLYERTVITAGSFISTPLPV